MPLISRRPSDFTEYRKNSLVLIYLKASTLSPALAVANFLVDGLVTWQFWNRLAGLLACLVLLSVFSFAILGVCSCRATALENLHPAAPMVLQGGPEV